MQQSGGLLLPPVQTLVATTIFFRIAEENANESPAGRFTHGTYRDSIVLKIYLGGVSMKCLFKQNTPNCCYTYFRITGNFNPCEITEKLNLEPYESWNIGDKRKNGSPFDFASWHFGKSENYNIDLAQQMMETIKPLLDKIDVLNQIHNEYDVSFCLEVVPYLHLNNCTPSLAPSLEIMDFCTATRTEIDIDLYVY